MVKRFVKVALCQRGVTGSKEQNIAETVSMIEEAAEHCPGLDLIIFPEYNYYESLSLEEARANSETDGRTLYHRDEEAGAAVWGQPDSRQLCRNLRRKG